MFRMRRNEIVDDRIEFAGTSWEVVSSETTLHLGGPGFEFRGSYRRPTRVQPTGEDAGSPIRDHVVVARLLALAFVLSLSARRLLR